MSLVALATSAAAQADLRTAVKATFLYKFAPFVDWPRAALGGPASPFTICIVGRDPFGRLLDEAVAGQKVGDHPIVLRRMAAVEPGAPCQIMFMGGSPTQPVREALHVVEGAPVLTVTDHAASPGVIDFTPDPSRVRFRIDDEAAAQHGLVIRSQLLSLAASVTPRRGPAG